LKDHEVATPFQTDLKTIQSKFKKTASDWLDHYRQATGISYGLSSKAAQRKKEQRPSTCSVLSTNQKVRFSRSSRAPSAPLHSDNRTQPRLNLNNKRSTSRMSNNVSFISTIPSSGVGGVVGDDGRRSCSPDSAIGSTTAPFKCGLLHQPSTITKILPKDGCPVALRQEIHGEKHVQCRCDNRKVPYLTDVELDKYLSSLPKTQLVVLSIVASDLSSTGSPSSTSLSSNEGDRILEKMYRQLNKNRSIPCVQSRHDPYRLFRYSIASNSSRALLVSRHNIINGMLMMYQGGRLLFADFIFDGYGNSKKDFMKQISRSRREALNGRFLPDDFRFGNNPSSPPAKPVIDTTAAHGQQRVGKYGGGKGGVGAPTIIEKYPSNEGSDDQVVEMISSEKVIAGTQMKINLFLANESKAVSAVPNDLLAHHGRRKTRASVGGLPANILSKFQTPAGVPSSLSPQHHS